MVMATYKSVSRVGARGASLIMDVMENSLAVRLVPDDLWELVEALLPSVRDASAGRWDRTDRLGPPRSERVRSHVRRPPGPGTPSPHLIFGVSAHGL